MQEYCGLAPLDPDIHGLQQAEQQSSTSEAESTGAILHVDGHAYTILRRRQTTTVKILSAAMRCLGCRDAGLQLDAVISSIVVKIATSKALHSLYG